MELQPGHEILNKDDSILTLKFLLTEIPTSKWTNTFNRRDYFNGYEMTSIQDSSIIYVQVELATYYKNDVEYKVLYTVDKTNSEVASDELKIQQILRQFVPGMIVMHLRSELSYDDNSVFNDPELPDYEYYIKEIAERTQSYQANP